MGHRKICEVVKFVIPINIFLEENVMPQKLQIFVNLTINPAPPPPPPELTDNPPSSAASPIVLPNETVGVPVPSTQITQLAGGTPPYGQPVLDPASPNPLPPGLSFATDDQGNVTVSSPTGPTGSGSAPFTLLVTDSGA